MNLLLYLIEITFQLEFLLWLDEKEIKYVFRLGKDKYKKEINGNLKRMIRICRFNPYICKITKILEKHIQNKQKN